jgi:hypothetical protein
MPLWGLSMKSSLLFLVVVGCFDAGSAPLICSNESPACPDGTVCINTRCEAVQDELGTPADMTADDMRADGAVSACVKADGTPIGSQGAWACPGLFGGVNPKAAALCRSGKVCTDSLLFTKQECLSANTGFFASSVWGATDITNPKVGECFGLGILEAAFYGCGKGFNIDSGCAGFATSLQVIPKNMLSCPGGMKIENLINTNPLNGVICCP